MANNTTKKRILTFLFLCLAVLLGFYMWRYYDGWAGYWVRYYLSGAIYVIIWSLLFYLFRPSPRNALRIPFAVFIATCAIEFLQLWKPHFLEAFRSTLEGAAIIGTCFVWLQFPFYFLGALVSALILILLAKIK